MMLNAPGNSYEDRVKFIEDHYNTTVKITDSNGKKIIPDRARKCALSGTYVISVFEAICYIEYHPDLILEITITETLETGTNENTYKVTKTNNEYIVFKNDILVGKYNDYCDVDRYVLEDGGILCL